MDNKIFETEKIFRYLMNCTSRPGMVNNISNESKDFYLNKNLSKNMIALGSVLIDKEVNFYVVGSSKKESSTIIKKILLGKESDKCNADYIFVLLNTDKNEIIKTIQNGKAGTLLNPHHSATFIFEIDSVTSGKKYKLSGPGIKVQTNIQIELDPQILNERNIKNKEFPLGIDLILIDLDGNIMSIPRSTKVERGNI